MPATIVPAQVRRYAPLGHRPRYLDPVSDTRILDPSSSTLGTQFIQPEQIIRDTDGSHWCSATFTTTGGVVTCGWLKCPAGSDPRVGSNWSEVGAITGIPTNTDAPFPFRLAATYYVLAGGKSAGTGVRLYKSAGGINGTYSLVAGGDLIPVGGAGTWNVARVTEPCYFRKADGTHVLLVMGFDTGSAHEQIGMFTCPSGSSIETPGNWTAAAGNPVIAHGAAGSDDEQVVGDPALLEIDGTYYILYFGGASQAVTVAVVQPIMLATTTDFSTFTKHGAWFESFGALWPPDTAPNTPNGKGRLGPNWRGHFFRLGPEFDYDVLMPYGANYGSYNGTARIVQARMAVFPIAHFEVPKRTANGAGGYPNPWLRLQSDSTDARVTKTGAGWATHTQPYENGGTALFSSTAGDRLGLYFQGSGVRVRGHCRNNSGMFNVYIDGTQVATDVDAYQLGDLTGNYWSVFFVCKEDLPAGQHFIEVEVSANKNPSSSGQVIFIDYFEWLPSTGS